MFYALAEGKIETGGYRFEHILQDIQTLNERAVRGELDITAVSIHAYAYVLDRYAMLPCGASMGDGYGPILVAKEGVKPGTEDEAVRALLRSKKIAVPGRMTSAYLALRLFAGECDCVFVPFDEVFDAVRGGEAEIGLLIHEGQLTYGSEGFAKVLDLGEWWTRETGLPLPLGGNVVRKEIEPEVRSELGRVLRESIRYGLEHRREGVRHSMPLARGLDEAATDRFIGMYVNDYTLDYGEKGRRAVHEFLGAASEEGIIAAPVELEFVS
jgi:1,4-dihydroxy-6-naphthoate synthase